MDHAAEGPAVPIVERAGIAADGHTPASPTAPRSQRTVPRVDEAAPAERKHAVLSQATAARARSIADAVDIKHGDIFLVCQPDGQIPARARDGHGLYYHDCRYLRTYEIQFGTGGWDALGAAVPHGGMAVLHATSPEFEIGDTVIAKQSLVADWTRQLDGAGLALHDRIRIANHGTVDVDLPVRLAFDVDFRDIFAIRGMLRGRLGRQEQPRWDGRTLRFRYVGADRVERTTSVSIDRDHEPSDGNEARLTLHLPSGSSATLAVDIVIAESPPDSAPDARQDQEAAAPSVHEPAGTSATRGKIRTRDAEPSGDWLNRVTQVETNDPSLTNVLQRALFDLRSLRSTDSGDRYFAAGVPWFVALFGRDSLITADQVLMLDAAIAADTLRLLASRQGQARDAWRDEEPGKILHELRVGEYARTGRIPHTPYYGSVDSTPLFLMLIAHHAAWTGDLALFRELRESIDAALGWMDGPGDRNGDGYIEYDSGSEHGLANQGWKDSGDAIVDAEGKLATPPISLVEVQGYAFAARMGMADLFDRDGDGDRARQLRDRANALQARFEHDFWLGDGVGYALALQGDGTPCAVRTSNPGHALWTGIASPAHAASTARLFMDPTMFGGWGVRTFAQSQARYNPVGYHLGTVWPHDNGIAAAGLRRYGQDAAAMRIAQGIIGAAAHFPDDRLPELFAGFAREGIGGPVRYPIACHPQAWAAGSVPSLLTTLLGLQPAAFDGRLRIVRPMLPPAVQWLRLRKLRVGSASTDLLFRRSATGVEVDIEQQDGTIEVILDREAITDTGATPGGDGAVTDEAGAVR